FEAKGKVGVKISTGESNNSNHLRPALIGDFVKNHGGIIVECNTAYGGNRASNAAHKQAFKDRGYDKIAQFDLLDEEGSMSIPVSGGIRLKEDFVGTHFANYDSFIVLSHFKGHAMAGFGGAMKNLSIGFGSGTSTKQSGKALIHSGGASATKVWGFPQDNFTEAMAEASKGVCDYMAKKGGMAYINVMNRLSVDCDCNGNPAEPDMHDIGILASLDPLAIDQACIDLVWTASDSGSLIERVERQNGRHILEHAQKIGLGSRNYRLIELK
ncbi:MAG: DUF362 domain-containing protein, partial [Treponema sp.]|nr:DUF362 domain-containing protein [Treponema sp.]